MIKKNVYSREDVFVCNKENIVTTENTIEMFIHSNNYTNTVFHFMIRQGYVSGSSSINRKNWKPTLSTTPTYVLYISQVNSTAVPTIFALPSVSTTSETVAESTDTVYFDHP